MLLKNLSVENFRCYESIVNLPIHKLTVFIGENDSGKTALLDALYVLLTSKSPSSSDFRQLDSVNRADKIVISGKFDLEAHDSVPLDLCSPNGGQLVVTKTFQEQTYTCEVECLGFGDKRFNNFEKQQAAVQKELLEQLDIEPARNAEGRIAQFKQQVESGNIPRELCNKSISFAQISEHLPRFEYISSTEYKQPDSLIQRTLQGVADSVIRPIDQETKKSELLPDLDDIKNLLQTAFNEKINEITEILRRFYPDLQSVQVSSNIDFLRSFTAANLMLDFGDGPQLLNTFGEGTKKKVWMCLLDWEKQIQEEEEDSTSVFRVYDEPDVNLDYSAERKLFLGIIESVKTESSKNQAIVSTHSVTLIDRALIESIRLVKVNGEGLREIEFFDSRPSDEEVVPFMLNVGSSVGISNSLVLYEKAFLVVEGESEENALPILYKNLYGRSPLEDGIVLVNLFSYSSWKTTLKFLGNYRSDLTVVLLDEDCRTTNPGSRLTYEALEELGYPLDFLDSSCFYIGSKEFEDAFRNDDLLATLEHFYPKADSTPWQSSDIDDFRQEGHKFANELVQHVRRTCLPAFRSSMNKPEFSAKLASKCRTHVQVPQAIQDVFNLLREKAGISQDENVNPS